MTAGTALIEPSIVTSTLETLKALPARLDDQQMQMVSSIAKAELPSPVPTDDRHFAACMKALSILPRRRDDEATGEVRLKIFRSTMGHLAREQLDWLTREAVKSFEWFPSVKQLLDLAEKWTRADEAVEARRLAKKRMNAEIQYRIREQSRVKAPPITQDAVDAMSPEMQRIGLKAGALIEVDGKVVPAP